VEPHLAEAWWTAIVLLAGLCVGSLGLLLIGRLLGRAWLTPIDDELDPAARTLPFVAVLALPLLGTFDLLYGSALAVDAGRPSWWHDGSALLVRSGLYFACWSALALYAARPSHDGLGTSAVALALLLPTVSLAGFDWILAREPYWWSSALGLAFAASQLPPALALAFVTSAAQREHVERLHDRSLASALLTFALAASGLWAMQFLVAWLGNLPDAAAWYGARLVEGRGVVLAASAALTGVAVLLLLQRHRGRATVLGACGAILAAHALHTLWLLRPATRPAPGTLDAAVITGALLVWLLPYAWLLRRRARRDAQSTRSGSSYSGRSGSTSGGQDATSPERSP
jgi:hypothetical protein